MTAADRAYLERGLATIEAGGVAITAGMRTAATAFRTVERAFAKRGDDVWGLLTGDPIRDAVILDMARAELAGGAWTVERLLSAVAIVVEVGQVAAKLAGALALL